MNLIEIWRSAYEMGYYYGRIDAAMGRAYDDRTPKNRDYPNSAAQTLSDGDAVTSEREAED